MIYKGSGWLDLRAAELTAQVTTVLAVAYKSRVDILLPPGVRVEMDGFGVTKGWSPDEEWERQLPHDAPVVPTRRPRFHDHGRLVGREHHLATTIMKNRDPGGIRWPGRDPAGSR